MKKISDGKNGTQEHFSKQWIENPMQSSISLNDLLCFNSKYFKGMDQAETPVNPTFSSTFSHNENNNNLMIKNGPMSPHHSLSHWNEDQMEESLKKRDQKAFEKDFQLKTEEISKNPSICLSDWDSKHFEKAALLSVDHSISSDMNFLKEDNFANEESEYNYSNINSFNLEDKNNHPLAIKAKSPLLSEQMSPKSKNEEGIIDSISSFSAEGLALAKIKESEN